MKKNSFFYIIAIAAGAILLNSCGIEEYPYIDPIPQGNIDPLFNNRATVYIPNGYERPFDHFVIFYRIYVSDFEQPSTSPSMFSAINKALVDDYNSILPYIGSETVVNANMNTVFSARKYKYLVLEGDDINSVLSYDRSIMGKTLIFDFGSFKAPTMTVAASSSSTTGLTYSLLRSDGSGAFKPLPENRYFINSEELWKASNINENVNADVVNKDGIDASRKPYTFAAMFVAAMGTVGYTTVYSTPAFIHAFQLPEQW